MLLNRSPKLMGRGFRQRPRLRPRLQLFLRECLVLLSHFSGCPAPQARHAGAVEASIEAERT